MRESLENVKVGDVVIEMYEKNRKIATVTRLTKTMVYTGGYYYFLKKNGLVAGCDESFWHHGIRLPKEGEIEEIQRIEFVENVVLALNKMTNSDLTYEQAVKIKEVMGL